jgi:hypothetical protein
LILRIWRLWAGNKNEYTMDDFIRISRIILLTPLLIFVNLSCWLLPSLRCQIFQSWCDAHAYAVWCSWCTLEWPGYPYDELVIARAIIGWEKIWVASRFLTTKIPSVLLVAVVWLQHTHCPRFRHGTVGYGVTTSPMKRGRVGVWGFHVNTS